MIVGLLPTTRSFVDEAQSDDAERLAVLHAEGFARGWTADEIAALMSSRNVFTLALRRESPFRSRHIVGFAMVRTAVDESEVLTIVVGRSRRGGGYGRMLMEEALRRLYRERVATCFLEVNRDNVPAVSLYRRLGFEEVGTRRGYYPSVAGSDGIALVMRLQLRQKT